MRTITKAMCLKIDELLTNGATIKKVKAYLVMEDIADKEANEYIKSLGLNTIKVGFKAEFFDWLAEKPRTKDESKAYILDERNSSNVHKSLSTNLNIAELAQKIWAQKETKTESEGEKKAWEQYEKVKAEFEAGKNPKATRVHPDKVAKFKNDELTKAYTSLFQEINR